MIGEAHEVVAEVDIIADSDVEASSSVVVFEVLGRPLVGMVKGYLLSSMVLSPIEFLHSLLRYPLSSFVSIGKPLNS